MAKIPRPWAFVLLLITVLIPALVVPSPLAQMGTDEEVHSAIDAAEAEIERIQARADSVEAQIDSIDDQAAAVGRALDTAKGAFEDAQARRAVLRVEVDRVQRRLRIVQQDAEAIAVALYKAGETAALEAVLGAESIVELSDVMEHSSTLTETQLQTMIRHKRLRTTLRVREAELQATVEEAKVALRAREKQAQHLSELRSAQAKKLGVLRREISAERAEAEALVEKSQEIAASLAAASQAPVASGSVSAAGASGFSWPISGSITSGYGYRWGRMHQGIDIDCVTGAAIRASKSGTVVTAASDSSGYGNYVVIDHGGGFATLYAHNSSLAVSAGQSVARGQVVSSCGSTGASTGDHLHFEVRVNGEPRDPLAYLP